MHLSGEPESCAPEFGFTTVSLFFLFPTRAWELAMCSLGAICFDKENMCARLRPLLWPAIAALLVWPFFPTGLPHPGVDALLVCAATLMIILVASPALGANAASRGLARIGDIPICCTWCIGRCSRFPVTRTCQWCRRQSGQG